MNKLLSKLEISSATSGFQRPLSSSRFGDVLMSQNDLRCVAPWLVGEKNIALSGNSPIGADDYLGYYMRLHFFCCIHPIFYHKAFD